jgi:processive 1,2-diacylglycerol beta-glucosyltransferase
MNPRTALLSYALGTGHRRVAELVQDRLASLGHACEHRPLEEWVPWEYDALFRSGYLLLALRFPKVWDYMYESSFFIRRGKLALPGMGGRVIRRFERAGLSECDLVVATQYNAMEVAADWKRASGSPLKLAVVITDYDVYPLWARPEVDLYLIPHADLVPVLTNLGVAEERIAPTGIPVAPAFEARHDGLSIRAKLGLDLSRPTALIFGGGIGAGPLREAVEALLELGEWQLLVVCGLNEKLRRSLTGAAQKHSDRLRVLGFRSDMALLMAASDVVVTKGGGLSLSEALYMGKRVVALPSLPGQERANIAFMAERGWISICENPRQLRRILEAPPADSPVCLPPAPLEAAVGRLDALARSAF